MTSSGSIAPISGPDQLRADLFQGRSHTAHQNRLQALALQLLPVVRERPCNLTREQAVRAGGRLGALAVTHAVALAAEEDQARGAHDQQGEVIRSTVQQRDVALLSRTLQAIPAEIQQVRRAEIDQPRPGSQRFDRPLVLVDERLPGERHEDGHPAIASGKQLIGQRRLGHAKGNRAVHLEANQLDELASRGGTLR